MENPDTWDLITASLAVSDLSNPHSAWAFLVVQNLVKCTPMHQLTFVELVRREQAKGPITGPSLPARVAAALKTHRVTRTSAHVADPNADIARKRRNLVDSWDTSGIQDLRVASEYEDNQPSREHDTWVEPDETD